MSDLRHFTLQLEGKDLHVELTSRASQALAGRESTLNVEMELYFSCLIRKRVRFTNDVINADYSVKNDKLAIGFKPIMTQRCSVQDVEDTPPTTDFPISRAESFIPNWLHIDFKKGEWQGEFGYVH